MKHSKVLYLAILLILIIFIFPSCEKEEIDKLPEITSEGLNTFGCLINGEAFIPERRTWTDVSLDAIYIDNEDIFIIVASNKEFNMGIEIYHPKSNLVSHFEDSSEGFRNKTELSANCSGSWRSFFLDSLNSSQLIISKFDLEHQIASGTFEIYFDNKVESCDSPFILSEGRFDLPFSLY